jgi:uncharacterized membrane protein YdcZ (DUF606 family)
MSASSSQPRRCLSVIFDHFGWLGLSQHSAGIGGVLGCALMVIRLGLVSLF